MSVLGMIGAVWLTVSFVIASGCWLVSRAKRRAASQRAAEAADLMAVVEATRERAESELLNSLIREAFRQAQEDRGYVKHGIAEVERYLSEVS